MAKLTAEEIEQHHKDDWTQQDADHEFDLRFEEAAYDEVVEEPYDPRQDDWLFDDYDPYEYDRYDDPYPYHDDDFY